MLRHSIMAISAYFCMLPCFAYAATVEVSVSEVGPTAMEAKQKAVTAAEKKAFSDYVTSKAPQQAAKILAAYDAEQISQFIVGYQVLEESMTDRSYRAKLSMDINDKAVGALFDTATGAGQDAAVTGGGESLLVLPVLRNSSGIFLWETDNQWRQLLNSAALQLGQGKLVMPYGDPTDKLMMDSGSVTNANFAMLSSLAKRYGVGEVLVAVLEPDFEQPAKSLKVDLRFFDGSGAKGQIISVDANANESLPQMMQRTADKIVVGLVRRIEKQQQAGSGAATETKTQQLQAVLPMTKLTDWVELQKRLKLINAVDSFEVLSADWQEVRMTLHYHGTPEVLGQELARANIHVKQGADALMLAVR